jgi:hypothetical protein
MKICCGYVHLKSRHSLRYSNCAEWAPERTFAGCPSDDRYGPVAAFGIKGG